MRWSPRLFSHHMVSRFKTHAGRRAPDERPPGDLRGGVHRNLVKPGTATFFLRAPYKPYVSLVGDFNGWSTRTHPMQTDGQGTWWTTIADPGRTRYGFYVVVDDDTHVWVGDPYAAEVTWTARGPRGLLHRTNGTSFRWTDQKWRTPPLRELVIYELCVRDVVGSWRGGRPRYGDFDRLVGFIPHLQDLGINAVEIMPIQAFPGESSWGYNPVFYHAIANTYGTPADFQRFVNECHRAGIAVILDVAFNHAWGDHPYYQIYPPLYGPDGERWTDWNPFFHHTPQSVNMWGGVDWDHFEPDTTRYFQDVVRHWLHKYHVDGFRFDWVGGVDYDHREPANPGFNPFHGITAICWAARQAKPDCILIGEYWPVDGAHPDKTGAKLVHESDLDAVWNGEFHHVLDDVVNQRWEWETRDIRRALGGFREQGFSTATQVVNYSCSHDEVRPEHEIKFYTGQHIPRPAGMKLQDVALARALLGLVAVLAVPGVPMIYAGQEYGDDGPRTVDFLPLQWSKLARPEHRRHFDIVRRLARARRKHPALRSDHIGFLHDDFARDGIVRFCRWDDGSDYAVVALNFSPKTREIELPAPRAGRWRDVVGNRFRTARHGHLAVVLRPYEAALFVPGASVER